MKRRIACLLICVCLLLCMALPAGAQDEGAAFTDRGRIRNVGAVQMLVDLGLISGYDDGTFRPGNFITREEVAKLVAILCTENPQAPADVYFYDAQNSWALGYIGYCAGQGIIAGDGMGSFRPKDNVTAQELAKMLLVILGQDPASYTGAGWDERVNADAQSFGIYYGLTAQVNQPVTRDNACLLIYNAMRCPAIADPDAEGPERYVLDDLMNPRSYLEVRYDLTRYTAVLTGNEYADLTSNDGRLCRFVRPEPSWARGGYLCQERAGVRHSVLCDERALLHVRKRAGAFEAALRRRIFDGRRCAVLL